MSKKYTANVSEAENGEAIIPLPQELLDEVGWKEGDNIKWEDSGDGSWVLSKVEPVKSPRQLVLVETVQTFRHRYIVEVPHGKRSWALDSVTCEEVNEFSQKHLDETIFSCRYITAEEMMQMHLDDNEYLRSWDEKMVMENMVTRLDDKGNII